MKPIMRTLFAGLLVLAAGASAQVNINAPAAPRALTTGDKVLVKLDGDSRGYLAPLSGLPASLPAFTGDCTKSLGGTVLTCTKSNGVLFGAAAFLDIGTGSGTVAAGNDSRFGDAAALTTGTLPIARIASGAIGTVKLGDDITSFGKTFLAGDAAAGRSALSLSALATTVPGTGIATWLATPSSSNLAAAVTDETGSGSLVLATSPTLTTPTLGVATATSINKLAITAPATSATLAVADGKTLTASNTLTLAGTDGSTLNVGAGGTLGALATTTPGSGVATWAATPTSANLRAAVSDETGSGGGLVFATSPTLTTPVLGVATATSINKLAITAPATSATLTVADGKTFTANNTLTLSGTDGSTLAIGTGGTLGTMAYQASSSYITTTTATTALAGKLGNVETGASTTLALGAIADGQYVKRSGTSLVGDSAAAVTSVTLSELAGIAASSNTGRVLRITDLGNVGSVFVVSNGSNWVPWGGQQMIWISAPNSTLSGTTTEDEHTSVAPTMPSGLLTSRGAIDVRAWVDFSANVSGNTVRIKANGTNVYSVNTTQQFNSAAILIANDNSTTAQFAPAIPTLTSGGSSGAETALSINTGTTAIAITVHTQVADGGTSRTVKRVEAWWRDR